MRWSSYKFIRKDVRERLEKEIRVEELKKKIKLGGTDESMVVKTHKDKFLEENPEMRGVKDPKLLEGMKTRRNKKTGQVLI